MMEAMILLGCGVFAAVGLGLLAGVNALARSSCQTVELQFGRDVTTDTLIAVLDRLSGLHPYARVVLDVQGDHNGLRHYVHADQATIETLRGALRAVLPSLRLGSVKPCLQPKGAYRFGRSIRLAGRLRAIRDDSIAETSAALLAAVQPLGIDERLLLRWVIAPGRPFTVPAANRGLNIETEERRRLRAKNERNVVRARGLLAVQAGHPKRAAHLLGRITAVLRSRSTAYGHLRTTPLLRAQLKRQLARPSFFFTDRYASNELAGLLAWPIDAPPLPGLTLGTSPQLIPSGKLPSTGRVLGTATWPGAERPIAQPLTGALSHSLIVGPTGVGKSTLITNLASADVAAGRGVILVDGKGDTAEALLARISNERHNDVIVLDCGASGPQPGIQLFGQADPELAADVVLGVLSDLFKESWGPLSERYLRAGLMAVAHDPEGTIADLPYVYTDAVYRRRLVGKLTDPLTRATFAAFEDMSAAERQQQLSAAFNKLGALLGRPIIRTVLGQSHPKLDFGEVLRRQQIVVISLSPMRVGAPAARLIGAVTVFALFQAVQARLALPESRRKPFLVYVDEPKALGDLPMPLDNLLEQARGLGVGLTLAPQSLTQLPKSLRDAALTNVATRVVFRQDADDARLLARDLRGVTPDDLGDLAAYEAVGRIGLGPGGLAAPVTIKTAKPSKAVSDPTMLREYSGRRYGMSLVEVDGFLANRHQPAGSKAPVGRKRRAA